MAFIGGSDTDREQVGGFQVFLVRRAKVEQFFTPLFYLQEWPQVECCRLYTKFACRPSSLEVLPRVVSKAVRSTIAGRPEVANIDFPGDLLRKSSDIALPSQVTAVIKAPIMRRPLEAAVKEAIDSLSKAERPLIIVGKGTAFF